MALTRRACQPRAQARPRWWDRSRERKECRPSWLPPAVRASSSSDGQSRPSPPDHRSRPCCPTEKGKIKPPIDLFLVQTTRWWAICPICPTCTISVSPKWGCADRGAVTKPPLRDFSPLSFLPNILQTDKLVNFLNLHNKRNTPPSKRGFESLLLCGSGCSSSSLLGE